MSIGSEYLDIDMNIQCIGLCGICGEPIMENERIERTDARVCCVNCIVAQEENN